MVLGSGRRSRTRCGEGHEINSELLIPCVCVCGWAHQRWSVFHTLKLSSITMISFPFSKDQSMLLHYWCILGWGSLRVQAGLLFRNSCYFTKRMPPWNTSRGYMHTQTQHYSMAVHFLQKGISEHIYYSCWCGKGDNFKLTLLAKHWTNQFKTNARSTGRPWIFWWSTQYTLLLTSEYVRRKVKKNCFTDFGLILLNRQI